MNFKSTRNTSLSYSFAEAVRMALAEDGGLIVPERFPALPEKIYEQAAYDELAFQVLHAFVPELDETRLRELIRANYADFPIPIVKTGSGTFLELYHGPTGAFKDVALTFLPKIDALTQVGEKVYITATSGDTGKAALEAFKDQPGTKIMVFYPETGVAPLQKLQMQTQEGDNVRVVAIQGNFDDAQRGVKELLQEFSGRGVSSCNSINIARLLTQIPYYYYACSQLGRAGLGFIVPSGNFGDILAGWYAKNMGLDVEKLVVATNENKVLNDFINTGRYDRRRELVKTTSPSMDILVSSNVERLLFHKFGAEAAAQLMADLQNKGCYEVDPQALSEFSARDATEAEVASAIREVHAAEGYLMDPHTACAWVAWDKLGRPDNYVILSTASPFKFPLVIQQAITGEAASEEAALAYLSGLTPPHKALEGIFERPIRHPDSIRPDQMRAEFLKFAGGSIK